jgi:hypothetical protein
MSKTAEQTADYIKRLWNANTADEIGLILLEFSSSKDKKIEALKKEIESWKKKHFDMLELASDTIQKKNIEIQALKWSIQNFED